MKKLWQWFLSIFKSTWFKAFLMFAAEEIKSILVQIGQENYEKIKIKAIELGKQDVPGTQKAIELLAYCKTLVPGIATSAFNLLIESIVRELKKKGVIK